jgi:DNA-binding NarL/FixJ family response regulator
MAAPELGRRPAHAGDAATDAALAVVAADQFASRRIAATLEAAGLPASVVSRTADELLADPAASGLDAVILAIDPSRPEGLAAVRKLVKALGNSSVVVVSVAVLGAGVRSALSAGASAFVAEVQLESTLAVATRSALAGQVSLPRELHRCAVRPAFSHREKQVLALVVRGLGNRQIAARLFLSESTVKSHLASAFQKLGVRSRKEAATVLLDPDEGLGASILSVHLDQAG